MFNSHSKGISVKDRFNGFNPYRGISEFDGKVRNEEFLDWLYLVEEMFEYFDTPDHKNVRLTANKL